MHIYVYVYVYACILVYCQCLFPSAFWLQAVAIATALAIAIAIVGGTFRLHDCVDLFVLIHCLCANSFCFSVAAAVGPGGRGGLDWVGIYIGTRVRKNRRPKSNRLDKAPTVSC